MAKSPRSRGQITAPQGTARTPQTSPPLSPLAKPQADKTNLARTAAAIPKSDVIAESGYSAETMPIGVPGRNSPTASLTPAEASVPIVPTPATKPMAAALTQNSTGLSGPGTVKVSE